MLVKAGNPARVGVDRPSTQNVLCGSKVIVLSSARTSAHFCAAFLRYSFEFRCFALLCSLARREALDSSMRSAAFGLGQLACRWLAPSIYCLRRRTLISGRVAERARSDAVKAHSAANRRVVREDVTTSSPQLPRAPSLVPRLSLLTPSRRTPNSGLVWRALTRDPVFPSGEVRRRFRRGFAPSPSYSHAQARPGDRERGARARARGARTAARGQIHLAHQRPFLTEEARARLTASLRSTPTARPHPLEL